MTNQTARHRFLALVLPLLLAVAASAVNVTVTSPSTTTATVSLTPTIVANASSGYPISAWYIYVDSRAAWNTSVNTSSISAPLTLTAGTHQVLVRAWDTSGAYGTSTLTLTAVQSTSTSPVSVTISTPSNNATVGQPFAFKATGTSNTSSAVHGWYVYSDNVAVANGSGASASPSLNLAAGTHKLLARFWNTGGKYGDAWLTVTVSAATVPVPPSTAHVWDKIEDMSGWGHCTDCAANPADPTPPLAQYSFTQFQNTPSSDGSSVMFWIGGTDPYADALHWKKFGAQNSYHDFIWEFWVYGKSDSLKAQNLEFDIFQAVNGLKYMWGTQCNYKKGIWQTWNYTSHWLDTSIPCTKFPAGSWTRVAWYVQRTSDNRLKYISLSVGDTTYTLNQYQTPGATTWGDTLGVQFQQDMDSIPDPYYLWVDKVKLSAW